jgi:hypothetical protein
LDSSPKTQDKHKNAPHTRKPRFVTSGTSLSAFVMRKEATAAAPTRSQVAKISIGSLAFAAASNIEETIAFSVFSRASSFHFRKDSVLGSVMEA